MKTNVPLDPAPAPDGTLPRWVDRKRGAKIISERFGPTSPRTLEKWPIKWLLFNGKAITDTSGLIAVAQAKLDAAPIIMGGCASAGDKTNQPKNPK